MNGNGQGKERTITVTVESLKGGCLGGDSLPIKIVINHTKHVMSMKGVIITLYRHARVDTHPEIPIGPMSEKDKRKHDDYYPKSLTGLGGLSLSGAGSSHVFRKDLSQVVVPLIVDHKTLTTEITPKLRVPDDAFPSISCVPGSMISFKYYVEVIVDIQGKLSGQERYFTPAQTAASTGSQFPFDDMDTAGGGDRPGQHRFDQAIVDTAPIRRDRSVVTCVLEVIIGTQDSERAKGKGRAPLDATTPFQHPNTILRQSSGTADDTVDQSNGNPVIRPSRSQMILSQSQSQSRANPAYSPPPPAFRPPSSLGFEEGLSEKERLRRHEQSLLPSQPPGLDEDFASRAQASAPVFDQANGGPSWYTWSLSEPVAGEGSSLWAASRSMPVQSESSHDNNTYGQDFTSDWTAEQRPMSDDKQEMQRRQLEAQASEPPLADDEASNNAATAAFHVPTEEEVERYEYPDYGSSQHNGYEGRDDDYHLPRYER